jgi:hypothetical protein
MPIKTSIAAAQVVKLSSLPFYPANQPEAIDQLVKALADEADTPAQAVAAIEAILSDVTRAANAANNRSPSPGELRGWVQAQKEHTSRYWQSPEPPPFCRRCGGSGEQGIYGLTFKQIEEHPNGGRETCEWCGGTGTSKTSDATSPKCNPPFSPIGARILPAVIHTNISKRVQ